MDWDSAAEIEDPDVSDETEVPPAVVCFLSFLKEFKKHSFIYRRINIHMINSFMLLSFNYK